MIPDVSAVLSWLEDHPKVLSGMHRGIEREGLRVSRQGRILQSLHPESLGSALTHKWITTDFAEAMLEFITPADNNLEYTLEFLRDIHRYVARSLGDSLLWPMSMPCFIKNPQEIQLAQYGKSNIGRLKNLYREGLKNRYNACMQVIAGIHYNFSLPIDFWKTYYCITNKSKTEKTTSAGYLQLIRNYYRFGWIIPYLFGASPGICESFLDGKKYSVPLEKTRSGFLYLPYATSLRLSDLGYTNKTYRHLNITFNDLDEYVYGLKKAINTPCAEYQLIGLKQNDQYLQLNTNILQTENELYEPIRPKCMIQNGESFSNALMRDGIKYVEVRSLDINPFSPIGINADQARFLDLFLIWCALASAPKMSTKDLLYARANWNLIILEGRKPDLMLSTKPGNTKQPLMALGELLFSDLRRIAEIIDHYNGDIKHQILCDKLVSCFENPKLTLSNRLLELLIEHGITKTGLNLATKYHQNLLNESLQVINQDQLDQECQKSWKRQSNLEKEDYISFDDLLAKNNLVNN